MRRYWPRPDAVLACGVTWEEGRSGSRGRRARGRWFPCPRMARAVGQGDSWMGPHSYDQPECAYFSMMRWWAVSSWSSLAVWRCPSVAMG